MAGHSAFTLQTIVIYGIMSAGLAITYYKTKRIEYSMGVHILNNSISVLLSLFRFKVNKCFKVVSEKKVILLL